VYFINSDNPFFFVKGGSVYCNLTTEFLSIIYVHFRFQTYGMLQSTWRDQNQCKLFFSWL